ncbi:transposase [Streptomyces sp. NPDC044571]|uniref:transposase n=1 Tax=Streptomyces sp. NPDC044571 TaxID=3155371 RepID=UPI0034089849
MKTFTSERRWIRHAQAHLRHLFPYLPGQSGYNRRLRNFWGLRLHLVCTLHGLPVAFTLTGAKADERQTLLDMLHAEPDLVVSLAGQTLIADRHYYGRTFESSP